MGWRKRGLRPPVGDAPAGARGFYVVAGMSMLVSIDTSWRYFEHNLHITDIRERLVMFAVLEFALVACGYGMRANVQRHGRPGMPRLVAWVLCTMAGYMAWQLSGVSEGVARVVLGPVLGLVMLHLALGIEIRRGGARATAWARVVHELRERLLSRLGLADDTRDAAARTRDRAVHRAARLTHARFTLFRAARLARALRTGNVAEDSSARDRLLAQIATVRHAGDLATIPLASPWRTAPTSIPAGTGQATSAPAAQDAPAAPSAAADTEPASTTSPEPSEAAATSTRSRPTRTRPTQARSRRKPSSAGAGTRSARVSKAEYLERARGALTGMEPGAEVTAQQVQAAVPGITRSMSYVIANELTDALATERSANPSVNPSADVATEPSTDTAGTSTDSAADGTKDTTVDTAEDTTVDTGGGRGRTVLVDDRTDVADAPRLVSMNGGAR